MRRLSVCLSAVAVTAVLLPAPVGAQVPPRAPVDYVDPMIGTLAGGFAFPGPAAPFGMVQLRSRHRGTFRHTGYQYGDTSIRGFSHHHIESMGVHSNGDLPFMPTVGPVVSNDPRSFMSPFDHASEEAQAGYYRVLLERYGILAELTAGERVGMIRYTFPPSPQVNVIFDIGQSNDGWNSLLEVATHESSIDIVDNDTVTGTAHSPQGYTIHFAAEFDRAFKSFGTWDRRGAAPTSKPQASGSGAGGYVTFDSALDRDVLIKGRHLVREPGQRAAQPAD